MPSTLEVTKVTKSFSTPGGEINILKDISFSAQRGESLAITGSSGSGKSTLLNVIGSLDSPSSGSITLGETQVQTLKGKKLEMFRAQKIGFIFQNHHLLPQLTALENVMLSSLITKSQNTREKAQKLLQELGLAERINSFPWQLSGGECQRVAIARAMLQDAPLLLCDEPTGNLDSETGLAIVESFLQIAQQQGAIVIMVTHDLPLAHKLGKCLKLQNGTLVD